MKKNKFKVGDIVICINNTADEFTVGKCYKVVGTYFDAYNDRINIEKDDNGNFNGWCSKFFILATKTARILFEKD